LWRRGLDANATPILVRDEETAWKARPDWSPDGKRIIWSSYQGRQWHQLWLTSSAGGGDPLPLSYGEFDITAARWSPDGRNIAYISNESGNTELWVLELPGGRKYRIEPKDREYQHPMASLALHVVDETGTAVAARVSITGSDGRSYAPSGIPGDAWMYADDAFDRKDREFETHYFQVAGATTMQLPIGKTEITVWRGLEHAIARRTVEVSSGRDNSVTVDSLPLAIPQDWKNQWQSGDVHVHMNYAGTYRNTPSNLVAQATAEDLDLVFNLIVNKEQRIPDIAYFSAAPDGSSTAGMLLLHAQEFHTGYWGHLGLLGLSDHFLLPDYSAYNNTGLASPYPDNSTVADLAHQQGALVGYVHPFDSLPDPDHDPDNDTALTNGLPIDVALGNVDYYEVSGFSDYRPTQEVWYRLLNCGFRVTAAGGTDAMANFASLRGPVGLNRTYVQTAAGPDDAASRRDRWLSGLKAGHTMATNGPILSFTLAGQPPGGALSLPAGEHALDFSGFMQSLVAIDHLEVVQNGKVVQTLKMNKARNAAQFTGQLKLSASAWVVLRAWNEDSSPDIFDRFPFATTNPVFIEVGGQALRSAEDADYFLRWIARVREQTVANMAYNTAAEREEVLYSIDAAAAVFEQRK